MKPQFVTVTGVDDRTDLSRLASLSDRFPVEWAVLYSPGAVGVGNRFPSRQTIDRLFSLQETACMRLAAHLCGQYAKAVMKGVFDRSAVDLSPYRRVQVNHVQPDSEMLRQFAIPGQTVIAQWRNGDYFLPDDVGHQWLYDPSGGRGLSPSTWPINPTYDIRGYAGGIGLWNAAAVATAVAKVSPSGFWLDMETGARTDDWLDLDLVERILVSIFG